LEGWNNGAPFPRGFEIGLITIENHTSLLPVSLANQVSMFIPPEGSFDDECLRRYLENPKELRGGRRQIRA
jgi:hypothetical protein